MKQMQRDPLASTKARKAERKADEKSGLITIKTVKLDAQPMSVSTGFKKGGFKSAFGGDSASKEEDGEAEAKGSAGFKKVFGNADENLKEEMDAVESDTEDEAYEYYDPSRPTDCYEACPGR